jgi:HEPN domain-containing protein
MGRRAKSVDVARSEARLYLEKAKQFATEGRSAFEAGRQDAALLAAVHAAISAGDAITAALAGQRSAESDHQRAVDFLEAVVGSEEEAGQHIRQIRMLLAKKNVVEYESRRTTQTEAVEGVARAERVVAWAERLVRDSAV